MEKKFNAWVRPGVELVLASPLTLSRLFMRLDLPTFERPMNAISGRRPLGIDSGVAALAIKLAFLIFIRGPGGDLRAGEI